MKTYGEYCGVPRMSRSFLAQRLRKLEHVGIVERRAGPTYHLTPAGRDLESVVWGLGDWALRWGFGDPDKEDLDGAHLLWRVRQRLVEHNLPERRTVVEFRFPTARRGRQVWLLLDPSGSSVCERDEGFDVDFSSPPTSPPSPGSGWAGRHGTTHGRREHSPSPVLSLVLAFPSWFALSPFATRGRP